MILALDQRPADCVKGDSLFWPAALVLLAALVLGGGGSPAPLPELGLELLAALIAGTVFLRRRIPRAAGLLAALVISLPLLQLVPLPPLLWQALPGRESERLALELVGAAESWRPLALSPPRTLAALLALGPPLLLLLLATGLSPRGRQGLLRAVVATGLLTLLLGAAQLSGWAGGAARLFDPNQIYLTGFQANHNSTADVLLIAMLAAVPALRGWNAFDPKRQLALLLGLDLLLGLGLFLTASRTGLALLPLVLIAQGLMIDRRAALWLAITGALAAFALALLRDNPQVAVVFARFTLSGELRPELWRDGWFALGQYWPAGVGLGGFVPVMIAAERLEVVGPALPNRAHNDFLELAIEGGIPGLIVLLVIAAMLALAARRALASPQAGARGQALFGGATLLLIALHSLDDYPLRSMGSACLAALAAALLLPAPAAQGEEQA